MKASKYPVIIFLEEEQFEKLERLAKLEGIDRNEMAKRLLVQALDNSPRLGTLGYLLLQLQRNRPKPLMKLLEIYEAGLRRHRIQEVVG